MENSLIGVEMRDLESSQLGSAQTRTPYISPGKNNELHIAANSVSEVDANAFLSSLTNQIDVSSALLHQNSRGDTPLHCAARKGASSLVRLFISNMTNQGEKTTLLSMKNKQGDTALHMAARNNRIEVVDVLMEEDANLGSIANNSAEYPLYVALGSIANNSAEYPLYVAARKGFRMIAERLVHSPAAGPGGKTALHAAVVQCHKDVVNFLLAERPELCRERDDSGNTSLLYAASSGDVKIVQALLDIDDSTVLLSDVNGFSALHVAAAKGDIFILHEILARKPEFSELTNNKGQTFLHVAILERREIILCYVLVVSELWVLPLLKILSSGKLKLRFLVVLEELLNQPDDEGNTPLHLAVIKRDWDIISLLLSDNRVVPDNLNQEGQTPLDVASSAVADSPFDQELYMIMENLAFHGLKFTTTSDLLPQLPRNREEEKQGITTIGNNLVIVAVLIATVTFAAGFTLPGGYKSDAGTEQGMATLAKAVAFKVFLISDAIAMMSSIMIIWFLFGVGSLDHSVRLRSVKYALLLMALSVRGMIVAFAAGVFAVVSSECWWLAVLICVMAGSVQPISFTHVPWWQMNVFISLVDYFHTPIFRLVRGLCQKYTSALRPKWHVLYLRRT